MKKVKRFAGLFMMLLAATFAKAQDESKLETSISADVVNQYIWRGQDLGGTSFQPTLGIGCGGYCLFTKRLSAYVAVCSIGLKPS